MKRDHDKDSLSLQLKEMSGKGLSSEDINNALEQRVIVPMQIDFMRYNVKNTMAASCIFFSNQSVLSRQLSAVYNHIDENLESYELLQYTNKAFATEFLYSMDIRIQIWLQKCKAAEDREDVNDKLIDFTDDLDKVLL